MFWSIAKSKVAKEFGYIAPDDVHSLLYEHEKFAGDIFVAFALTGQLYGWEGEGDQKDGFRFDRRFKLGDVTFFLEVELGNKWDYRFEHKIHGYQKHYAANREPFKLLVAVLDGDIDKCLQFLPDYHYYAAHISDLSKSQLQTQIHSPKGITTLETILELVPETP